MAPPHSCIHLEIVGDEDGQHLTPKAKTRRVEVIERDRSHTIDGLIGEAWVVGHQHMRQGFRVFSGLHHVDGV